MHTLQGSFFQHCKLNVKFKYFHFLDFFFNFWRGSGLKGGVLTYYSTVLVPQ